MQKFLFRWSLISVPLLLALLFVSGPGTEAGRIYRQLWESGHFFLFAGIFFALLNLPIFAKRHPFLQLTGVILCSVAIGFLTEYVQLWFNRNFEIKDIINDLFGGLAGLFFFWTFNNQGWRRFGCWLFIVAFTLIGIRGFLFALADEYRLRRDFPVIANFEHFVELYRWDMRRAWLSLNRQHRTSGNYALRAQFYPDKYPDITLLDFGRNWFGYRFFEFDVFNPQDYPLKIELKIYDEAHRLHNYRFDDRFNRVLTLSPGKNHIQIPISEIQNAPHSRHIDLEDMAEISLFFDGLDKTVDLYFDYFHLTP